jgi:hypothetical protein
MVEVVLLVEWDGDGGGEQRRGEKEVDGACGIGIRCRVMSTSRDAIVRPDHGRLGAASFGFSFGCEVREL